MAVHFWIEPFLPHSLGTRKVWVCNRIPRRYFLFVILLPSCQDPPELLLTISELILDYYWIRTRSLGHNWYVKISGCLCFIAWKLSFVLITYFKSEIFVNNNSTYHYNGLKTSPTTDISAIGGQKWNENNFSDKSCKTLLFESLIRQPPEVKSFFWRESRNIAQIKRIPLM